MHITKAEEKAVTAALNSEDDSAIKRYAEILAIHEEALLIRDSIIKLNRHMKQSVFYPEGDSELLFELWKTQMEPVRQAIVEADQFLKWAMDATNMPAPRVHTLEPFVETPASVHEYAFNQYESAAQGG